MSSGKFISFHELRRDPKLLRRFIRERIAGGYGATDERRFERTLESMIKNPPQDAKTSASDRAEDCTDTQTRQGISPNASRRRAHASRE